MNHGDTVIYCKYVSSCSESCDIASCIIRRMKITTNTFTELALTKRDVEQVVVSISYNLV